MYGIKAKELKEALKDVPDDYVVRIDAPQGSVSIPDGFDRVGQMYNHGLYRLDDHLSEVKAVDVDRAMKEVVLDVQITLEEANG